MEPIELRGKYVFEERRSEHESGTDSEKSAL